MEKVEGVSNIETDIETQVCQFYLANKAVDLEATLNELAESNHHIAGWSFAEGG